ncbi:uracil-DNA glycosylase [Methylocystis sp. 9N]|uniref:Uracil-DNA glycosylase n=1 Tax=Methylocystis borbori TaxID=3118750 RepID=A0ABU7XNJ4_9HYPH
MQRRPRSQSEARRLARSLCRDLAAVELPDVFNPYRHNCAAHDAPHAAALRQNNLIAYLEAAIALRPETAWIGRDLGYRGGRRTGLPLTDEAHLEAFAKAFGAKGLSKATRTETCRERTAAEIWRAIGALEAPPFLWNAFPFHPHEADAPFGNRAHRRVEFDACAEILKSALRIFDFETVYALGADASAALTRIGVPHKRLRHPSFGGHAQFRRQMAQEYGEGSRNLPMNG